MSLNGLIQNDNPRDKTKSFLPTDLGYQTPYEKTEEI